ncbi:Ubiquitin-protein ligase E3A (E6AP ubiquitin-protein ligase) (HECT-type ubiquitin transferase E3A) (Human papillomavirus E6-associated protein) (Oncogenic protein-associated protein E6-AP) (Renal carcinoma antigen NY-REN-54) [Durusdinium trenchii]|uniref:HECT-type E3 ubiquitin transferase n=1 Tax=Durusdinium trenchii TaxID=1381693 RepID=A0ABP0IY25_9DINO
MPGDANNTYGKGNSRIAGGNGARGARAREEQQRRRQQQAARQAPRAPRQGRGRPMMPPGPGSFAALRGGAPGGGGLLFIMGGGNGAGPVASPSEARRRPSGRSMVISGTIARGNSPPRSRNGEPLTGQSEVQRMELRQEWDSVLEGPSEKVSVQGWLMGSSSHQVQSSRRGRISRSAKSLKGMRRSLKGSRTPAGDNEAKTLAAFANTASEAIWDFSSGSGAVAGLADVFQGETPRKWHGWGSHAVIVTYEGSLWQIGGPGGANARKVAISKLNPRSESVVDAKCGLKHVVALTDTGRAFYVDEQGSRELVCPRKEAFVQVASTLSAVFVLGASGRVYTTGQGPNGELALGKKSLETEGDDLKHIKGGLLSVGVRAITAGPFHVAALSAAGVLYAWGRNDAGELGRATDKPMSGTWALPADLLQLQQNKFTQASCGQDFTVLLSQNGEIVVVGAGGKVIKPPTDNFGFVKVEAMGSQFVALRDDGEALRFDMRNSASFQVEVQSKGHAKPAKEEAPVALLPDPKSLGDKPALDVGVVGNVAFAVFSRGKGIEKGKVISNFQKLPSPEVSMQTLSASGVTELCERPLQMLSELIVVLQDPYALSGSFLLDPSQNAYPGGSGVDVLGAERALSQVRDALLSIEAEGRKVKETANFRSQIEAMTDYLMDNAEKVLSVDQLRILFLMLATPLAQLGLLGRSGTVTTATRTIAALPMQMKQQLMKWVHEEVEAPSMLVNAVEPIARIVDLEIKSGGALGSPNISAAANVLRYLFRINEVRVQDETLGRAGQKPVDRAAFATSAVLQFDPQSRVDLINTWNSSKSRSTQRAHEFSLLDYPFLLSTDTKTDFVKMEGQSMMARRYQSARARGERPLFVLKVRRDHLLADALQGMRKADPVDLKMPLMVQFEGEEGIDAGGVKKEFFGLLSEALFDPAMGIFTEIESDGTSKLWFGHGDASLDKAVDEEQADNLLGKTDILSAGMLHDGDGVLREQDPKDLFLLVGQFIGLAIYNSTILDVQFPLAFYRMLLDQMPKEPSLLNLFELDPSFARGLQQLLSYDGDDVETVFGLDFGDIFEGGESDPVTSANKEEYVKLLVQHKLCGEHAKAIDSLMEGFGTVIDPNFQTFKLFRPDEVEIVLTGSDTIDMEELRESVTYAGGFDRNTPVVKWFWEIVLAYSTEKQRQLIRFATGSPRAPVGGVSALKFVIQRAGVDSEQLPHASTCFNILLLPEYSSKAKLKAKLKLALENAQGFGLQ